jgi:hypothetical protein
MEFISEDKKTDEKLFAWARLIAATIVFIFGVIVINKLMEAIIIKGGHPVRVILGAAVLIMLIVLVLNILNMQ